MSCQTLDTFLEKMVEQKRPRIETQKDPERKCVAEHGPARLSVRFKARSLGDQGAAPVRQASSSDEPLEREI
ncbi:hypothetical protein RRG08_026083 [Elysia crispata]|uniref:Uncharacterized protein n=1 Tax=Elysia crispata TaxID=231223 RepID=A0AAE0YR66_9GAST|nr:hypothetical protein RRG08_026083 [Elysia crispata]